ncbi:MFS transporter [Micromonospora aurantiaca (nom. illeg.)]|uniref:MFS transporter n=1 Tax=Micromonospora aurantiaca (nom. illeg.) TaxID=47850 RepID=UPI0011AC9F24|nr:MFS transporter [Micromonospora aurantiaca]MBC9000528.1 MFS transporter [Micromonospora aurantiaca]
MTVTNPRPAEHTARPGGRGLRAILASVGVSSVGDGMFLAAVPLTAAALTRSPTAVAAVTAIGYLPWVVVAPFAGALVDRWPYRATVLTADITRAVAVAALAAAVALDVATVWILAVIAAVVVTGQVFHDIALQAAVAELAHRDPDTLHHVNGRMFSLDTAGKSLIGPPVGAAAFTAARVVPYAVDAASFAASAALLTRLPRGLRAAGDHTAPIGRAVKDGLLWLARHRRLRTLALLAAAANLAYNAAWATFVLYATSEQGLRVTDAGFGLLVAALAAGGVVIGPLAHRITRAVGAEPALLIGVVAHAAAWPVIAVVDSPWVAAPLLAAIGASQTLITTVNAGLRQLLVPADMLGRVIAGFRTVANSASPAGAVLGGLIAASAGLRAPMVAGGVILAMSVAATIPTLLRKP